ncbi:hypothetical protein NP493_362g02120 [Ridgeia piscesae]|uniref:Uncharacterized protein n=1 Tax=Ridgeia piscesae TaxID=27915 RepID=A0AAD9L386_RIDPI|nr:hypothetical protein NP493_362g02120 [Ridgeia piscesae]
MVSILQINALHETLYVGLSPLRMKRVTSPRDVRQTFVAYVVQTFVAYAVRRLNVVRTSAVSVVYKPRYTSQTATN